MKIQMTKTKEVEFKHIKVNAVVRYPEDAYLNGEEDVAGKMPAMAMKASGSSYRWQPLINADTGVIENWDKGNFADIHYKVCDECEIEALDENGDTILNYFGYVPNFLCPKEFGYGDYIIMDVNSDGNIDNWQFSDLDVQCLFSKSI